MASCAIHLKSKAYFIARQEHKTNGEKKVQENLQDLGIVTSLQNLGIEISPERDILKLSKEFAEHDYYGYASLIFFVDHYEMENDILDIVYKYIKRNSTLKYVTKLVLNYSLADESFGETHYKVKLTRGFKRTEPNTIEQLRLQHPELKHGVYKSFQEFRGSVMIKVCAETSKYVAKYLKIMRKNIRKKNPFIDNLIVLTFFQIGKSPMHSILEEFVETIAFLCNKNCIQELAYITIENIMLPKTQREVICIQAFSSVECYIYNINPALAIVINHYSFPEKLKLGFRDGSEIDIAALKDLFRRMKITYCIIDDGSLENVQTIMQKVRTTEYNGIKDIYILIMSHGEEGDIIHTKTESYSIKDEIVLPLLENSTLANAQKYVIVNACRGEIEYDFCGYYEAEVQEKIQKLLCEPVNPMYPQNEKLMMIFSTQSGYKSFRWKEKGSIFVQELCESMTPDYDEKSMEAILQETKNQTCGYQIPDFQIDEHRPHTIKMEFANFFHNQELLDDMLTFFKTHFKEDKDADGTETDNDLYTIQIKKSNEEEWQLLGMCYGNGTLTDQQKAAIENHIKSDYDTRNVIDINHLKRSKPRKQ